ncbi:hypothetical protein HWV62_1967 [Athelia sp. TMB]|nr:hypothetical protein HWV62_1967 [Athelia sp. TMB]
MTLNWNGQHLEDAQKERDGKQHRLNKVAAEKKDLEAAMKEKESNLTHIKGQLSQARKDADTGQRRAQKAVQERNDLRAAVTDREEKLSGVQSRLSRLENVQKDAEDQKRRLERVRGERDGLRNDLANKEDALKNANLQIAQLTRTARESTERAHADAVSFREMMRQRDEEAKALRAEVAPLRAHLESALKLLDDRTRELKGAQPFLTKTDSLSGADVIALVQALNAESFQLAAFVADSFPIAPKRTYAEMDLKAAHHRIQGDLGNKLMGFLTTMAQSDDPTILQMALQCYLAHCCTQITNAWTFDGSSDVLVKLYEQVRDTGEYTSLADHSNTDACEKRSKVSQVVGEL